MVLFNFFFILSTASTHQDRGTLVIDTEISEDLRERNGRRRKADRQSSKAKAKKKKRENKKDIKADPKTTYVDSYG